MRLIEPVFPADKTAIYVRWYPLEQPDVFDDLNAMTQGAKPCTS